MYLTSTSTLIILIQDQVNHLYDAFGWTVGGIGITMTVALALLGVGQFLYTRKITSQEIDAFKLEIRQTLDQAINEQFLKLKAVVDDNIDSLRKETEQQRHSMEGDIARSYAVQCIDKDLHAFAFNWWLTAAAHYSQTPSSDASVLSNCIKSAKDSLDRILVSSITDINSLWEKMTDNQSLISEISKKHPTQAKLLEDLMRVKAALSGQK